MGSTWPSQTASPLLPGCLNTPDSKVHGANMGPSGSCRPPMDPMLAPWTLLSGTVCEFRAELKIANVVPIFKSSDEQFLQITDQYLSYQFFFLKFWKDLCIVGSLNLSMTIRYFININLVFKRESPQVWPWWLWLIKLHKLWTRENASLVFFSTFAMVLIQLIMVYFIFLQKLELYGTQDIMLKWLKYYLSNRIQCVIIMV